MNIYKITNLVNNKIYIGQTSEAINKRWCNHIQHSKNKKQKAYNSTICKAIRKYGKDNFKIELVKKCKSKQELDNYEKLIIIFAKQHQYGCYNIMSGGQGWTKGVMRSKENCENISNAWKEYYVNKFTNIMFIECKYCNKLFCVKLDNSGCVNKHFCSRSCSLSNNTNRVGKYHSNSTKEKMRNKALGHTRNLGKKYKPRKSNRCKGMKYVHSKEYLEKRNIFTDD